VRKLWHQIKGKPYQCNFLALYVVFIVLEGGKEINNDNKPLSKVKY